MNEPTTQVRCTYLDLFFMPLFIACCLFIAGDVASGGDRTEGFGE